MQVKRIAEGSILQFFRPSSSYHLLLRSLFCLFLSTVLTTYMYFLFYGVRRLAVRRIFLLKWDFLQLKRMDGSTGKTALESDGSYFETMGQWPGPTINLKACFSVKLYLFSYLTVKMLFGILRRTVLRDGSFEYSQHMLWLRNVKNNFQIHTIQGSHKLEKYLKVQVCLEKSLKIKFAMKSTLKHLKALKSLWIYHLQDDSTLFWRPKSV